MKKIIICTFLICVIFTACTTEYPEQIISSGKSDMETSSALATESKMPLTDQKMSYQQVISDSIDVYDFIDTYAVSNGEVDKFVTIDTVNRNFKIECLRMSRDEKYSYSLHKIADGGLLLVFYGNDNGGMAMWYPISKPLYYSDFFNIKSGKSSAKDVLMIDPAAKYFLYEKDLKVNRFYFSRHYLKDGILTIRYQNKSGEMIVEDMEYSKNFKHVYLGYSSAVSSIFEIYPQDYPQ